MLLYQWGVFDWGQGETFEFDVTRQFISARAFGDDAISQLRMTVFFLEPTREMRMLGAGNRWCTRPAETADFRAFIVGSPAFRLSNGAARKRVEVGWSQI